MNQAMQRRARWGLSGSKPTIVLVTALSVAVIGCQTTNPYTGEQEASKTTTGAGIGALAGGLVGNYMDREEAKLRAQLEGTGVSVTRVGDQITLNMPGNVTFATDSADISASFYPVLDSVALVLKEFQQTYVDVVGHTDSTGAWEHNQRLSEQRATSVSRYLASREVLPERLVTRGVGPDAPIASNDTPEGRALTRCVEIILTPLP